MRIMSVVAARPNFMKVAPVIRAIRERPDHWRQILVHTGQHYDKNMSEVFFDDLEMPRPAVNLEVGSGSHAAQTAQVMLRFEPVVLEYKPDWVLVVGDVNSTLACALVCSKLGIKVAHVEAGLRSFDRTMPEEINRIVTDQISDLLFTTEESANANLRREGIPRERIHFVGNVMIDTLVQLLPKAEGRPILRTLGLSKGDGPAPESGPYALVTLHRPSNVDGPETLREIVAALIEISREIQVIFPVHPRTQRRLADMRLRLGPSIRLLDPLGYLDFLALLRQATVVLTDSGGVQEETTFLGVPCLTARPNTERPVTVSHGTNRLIASDRQSLVKATRAVLNEKKRPPSARGVPALWDGAAAKRIVGVLAAQV